MFAWINRKYQDYKIWLTYKTWADQHVTLLRLSGCSNISYKMKPDRGSNAAYTFDFWFTPPKVVEHVTLKKDYWEIVGDLTDKKEPS